MSENFSDSWDAELNAGRDPQEAMDEENSLAASAGYAPIACPRCGGSNCVVDLGAPWAYEPGPCHICNGKEMFSCKKCRSAFREDERCACSHNSVFCHPPTE